MSTELVAGIDNYTFIFILAGGFIGTYLGLILPFYREKNKYGKEGIELLFDRDFLKIAGGALIISIIGTGAIYPQLTALADSSTGYIASFMAAVTMAFSINIAGNWIKGSNNKEAEEQLAIKRAERLKAEGRYDSVLAKLNGSGTGSQQQKTDGSELGGGGVTQPEQ